MNIQLRQKLTILRGMKRCLSAGNYHSVEHIYDKKLYDSHRPITSLQKGLLALSSAVSSLYNPLRVDMVAAVGETLFPENALRKMQLKMLRSETGCKILTEQPIINSETMNVQKLLAYPENTLGYIYASFMRDNKISPDTRSPVRYIDNKELAYIKNRYRQIHDFLHILLGIPISVPGEVIVKWFEMAHFELPMNAVAAFFGPLACTWEQQGEIRKFIPWALYTGRHADFLMNVYFENELENDFEELRKRLKIINPPFDVIS